MSGTGFASHERICEVYDNTVADQPHGTLVGFVVGPKAEETWALPDDERRAAILESFAAYFGDEAKRPLAVYLSDWGTEEFTRGAYGASWSLGGLSRWGHLQNRPVGPSSSQAPTSKAPATCMSTAAYGSVPIPRTESTQHFWPPQSTRQGITRECVHRTTSNENLILTRRTS